MHTPRPDRSTHGRGAGTARRSSRARRSAVAVASLCSLLAACTARNVEVDAQADTTEPGGSAVAPQAAAEEEAGSAFGDLPSPCGPGDLRVEPSEAGGSTDVLRIGVANDRSAEIRAGLNRELWDTANAFAAWCNEQGGIGGLPVELVDLDGRLFEVEAAMATACKGAFMMAGGGHVQDNLQFSGRADSDFHRCHLADIPGFSASAQKADSNGQVQPLPRSAARVSTNGFAAFREQFPDVSSMVVLWGQLPTMQEMKDLSVATAEAAGLDVVADLPYPPTGLLDWTPLAQQVIESDAESLFWVGEPTNLGSLMRALRTQGWDGVVLSETNIYDQVFLDSAGSAADGTVVRTAFHPFEESERWTAVADYEQTMRRFAPDGKVAMLGMQAMSAWLLFATAAGGCGERDDGVLTRACVLEAADGVEDWTAGGLHTSSDPGPPSSTAASCTMLLVARHGSFERLYPELGSEADDGDGFSCVGREEMVAVPANAGLGITSPDQPL
jgi:ABC-type branched-subunit amino acid transport system substrate-binding protein